MKYGRTDDNQKQVVSELRKLGISVAVTSDLGHGFPDLVIGYKGLNFLIELKDGKKPPSKRKRTQDQKDFQHDWSGWYAVACSLHEILYYINWEE